MIILRGRIFIYIKKLLHYLWLKRAPESHEERLETISQRLSKVKEELIDLIPYQYKSNFADSSFISGGCIYSLYNELEPKDYDFFLQDQKLADDLRDYFQEASVHKGEKISGGMYEGLPLVVTDNAISIGKYQIITRFIGSPEEVVGEFDFKHNEYYWNGIEVIALEGFEFLKSKELKYNEKRARDIVGTIVRVPRFLQRGMSISNKEFAKMLLKLSQVGFNERELEILNDARSDKHFGS